MTIKIGRLLCAGALLIVLTLLLSSPLAAQPAERETGIPSNNLIANFARVDRVDVATGSDVALQKLSPDLRASVETTAVRPTRTGPANDTQHLVFVLIRPGTSVERFMISSVASRRFGELQWVTGEVKAANLLKLAGLEGVFSVTSTAAYQPMPAPGLEEMAGAQPALTRQQMAELLASGGPAAVLAASANALTPLSSTATAPAATASPAPNAIDTIKVTDIHRVAEAHAAGYTGEGVVAAVIDSGVDFGATDLQGTQARVEGGPYDGWPFAYDTLSGVYYALDSATIGPDNYWEWVNGTLYAHTLPIEDVTCDAGQCSADLMIDAGTLSGEPLFLPFTWPDTSQSGIYYYTVHPDLSHLSAAYLRTLGYASEYSAPAAVIVADEVTAGVYDTVYVDADFDQDLGDEKPMSKGDELSGTDLYNADGSDGGDGLWDLSVSMLSWIADGENPPPGVGVLYPNVIVPKAGRLIAFVGDSDAHGTAVASMIAGQSVITDPYLLRQINPRLAGGAEMGGVGGPVTAGMAPDARIAAFMNGFNLPFDSWTLAVLGFDGAPQTGDEAHVINNSWGDSSVVEDGWDSTSRFAQYLNQVYAPHATFLVSTGNGGPGYGTTTSPGGGTLLKVGASTSYGSSTYFELVAPDQFTYGAIQPWSNRGPSGLGDVDPDLVCVGAWGFGSTPLNRAMNGQGAYDLFGGTSMSSPVCAGIAAMVYESFQDAHGRWPTWQEATDILNNGAHDLGYNALAQGAGNADALRSTAIAAGAAAYVTPSQWQVGDYRGENLTPGFPAIIHPGQSASIPLTLHNPTDAAVTSELEDVTLQRVHEISFTVTLGAGNQDGIVPDYLRDISDVIDDYDPDLVSAHVMFPFSVFDRDENYYADTTVTTLFYDWKDLNGDGNLWEDLNGNGRVESDEIDKDGPDGFEFNRYTYAYATANYQLADLGRDALSRRHDGVFFGLQRFSYTEDIDVTVQLILYKKADWDWLSLSAASVNVPAAGMATVTATMAVPDDARLGLYEGAIEYDGQVIPVITHVAADSATFEFGATSLDESLGDTPYDNGHLLGSTDWGWRPETGDWKQFYYDAPDGATEPGTGMVVTTEWAFPEASNIPPLPESALYETFEDGIPWDWPVITNVSTCGWQSTGVLGSDNWTGGEGLAAETSSSYCMSGVDTELYTPIIDLSGQTEAWLAFHTHFIGNIDWQGNILENGYVDISEDGGATWTNLLDLQTYTFVPQVIDLSDYAGGSVQLRFRYVAQSWSFWWQLDDVGVFMADPTASYVVPVPDLTDVDTAIFGAAEDDFSAGDPAFFGPSGVGRIGGSRDAWLSNGTFAFYTETDGPKEIVGGLSGDGLGYVSLHNVLNAGRVIGEPVVGRAYQLSVAPAPLTAAAETIVSATPPTVRAELQASIKSTADIPEGLSVLGFGLSQPIRKMGEPIAQDTPNNICSATWVYPTKIRDGGLLQATTTSSVHNLDVDLYLWGDNGDGALDCNSDYLIASSAGPTSEESIALSLPVDAQYWIMVHGYSVPGTAGVFDIAIDAIQGHDLVVNAPAGPVAAGVPVTFDLSAEIAYKPGSEWQGLIFVGAADGPTAINLPVTITVPALEASGLSARFTAAPEGLATGETTTLSLWAWNGSTDSEVVDIAINVPPGLVVDIASVSASQGHALYNLATRTVTWSGTLAGSQDVTITVDATAASRAGQVEAAATVAGLMRGNVVRRTVPLWLNVEPPPRLISLPIVAKD